MKEFKVDELLVKQYDNRVLMGEAAARDIAAKFKELLSQKDTIHVIFAAAPSQNDVLKALVEDPTIEWNRIRAFHMDEYIGLSKAAPQGFGNFLREHIFGQVPFLSVHYIDCEAKDIPAECERYTKLLEEYATDVVVMGIGENGHIAFNDPPVADFCDTALIKPVKLDEICRNQQVNDGCFETLDQVPTHALTLTVPALMRAPWHFCIVPAATKADAVKETLTGSVDEHCPATVLRTASGSILYLDEKSSAKL